MIYDPLDPESQMIPAVTAVSTCCVTVALGGYVTRCTLFYAFPAAAVLPVALVAVYRSFYRLPQPSACYHLPLPAHLHLRIYLPLPHLPPAVLPFTCHTTCLPAVTVCSLRCTLITLHVPTTVYLMIRYVTLRCCSLRCSLLFVVGDALRCIYVDLMPVTCTLFTFCSPTTTVTVTHTHTHHTLHSPDYVPYRYGYGATIYRYLHTTILLPRITCAEYVCSPPHPTHLPVRLPTWVCLTCTCRYCCDLGDLIVRYTHTCRLPLLPTILPLLYCCSVPVDAVCSYLFCSTPRCSLF